MTSECYTHDRSAIYTCLRICRWKYQHQWNNTHNYSLRSPIHTPPHTISLHRVWCTQYSWPGLNCNIVYSIGHNLWGCHFHTFTQLYYNLCYWGLFFYINNTHDTNSSCFLYIFVPDKFIENPKQTSTATIEGLTS